MFYQRHTYKGQNLSRWSIPNYWDVIAIVFVVTILGLLTYATGAMFGTYELGQSMPISLDYDQLPYYSLRSVVRMFIAMIFALICTFIFGTLAATNKHAERLILSLVDILQSVPVLGFLSITVVGFIHFFHGSYWGPESAAIFAIFVAQVWNMILSFYQSLITIPSELDEATRVFKLNAWQRFWRLKVPYSMPGLVWNTMMSMSASWVFLVECEAFSVGDHSVTLPGLGSYIALAIQQADTSAIFAVIITMFFVILIYDQIFFRPLVAWSEKFKMEHTSPDVMANSWVLNLFQRTVFFQRIGGAISWFSEFWVNGLSWTSRTKVKVSDKFQRGFVKASRGVYYSLLWIAIIASVFFTVSYFYGAVTWGELGHVFYLGFLTATRVMALIVLSTLIWVPIGVWIGLSPKASKMIQPLAQFFAAFPVNLLYPLAAVLILTYKLNINIWCAPLMILGAQWYILFNVIAGVNAIPKHLHQATATLQVRGWLWWKRLILPSVFPYYITGALTAAGGAWNISIIAEFITWGDHKLIASGLGSYITQTYDDNDFMRLVLGVIVMSFYVLLFNRILWRPLYRLAEQRFGFN